MLSRYTEKQCQEEGAAGKGGVDLQRDEALGSDQRPLVVFAVAFVG